MKNLASIPVLLALLLAMCGSVAGAADEITFSQVAKAAKVYLRDSAEFPMFMKVDFTVFDKTGHVRKHKTGSFTYNFHGLNPRSFNSSLDLHGPKPLIKAAAGIGLSALVTGDALIPNAEKVYAVTLAVSPESGIVSVRMVPVTPCAATQWIQDYYIPHDLCGPLNLRLNKDDVSLQSFTFDETSVPIAANIDSLGAVTISAYHAEGKLQKMLIAGDPNPFLVPERFTVAVETDKGKITMQADYTAKR